MGLETNSARLSVFLYSSSVPRLVGGGLVRHSLPGAKKNASTITLHYLLF